MKAKRNIRTVVFIGMLALLCTLAWTVFADDYEQSVQWGKELAWSPEGVWVLSIPTPAGAMLMLHAQHAQDLAGTRFGGSLSTVNDNPTNFGMLPEGEKSSACATQTVRTGPDTLETTMINYAVKKRENMPDEILVIYITHSTWTMTGPDTKEGTAMMSTYLASQDMDQDGFPDEGQEPVSCDPFTFTGRRLRVMPSCVPTPMPGQ